MPMIRGNTSNCKKHRRGRIQCKVDALINQPIEIVHQPESIRVISGEGAQFQVEVIGSQPIRYQWLFNNILISNSNSPELILNNVNSVHEGSYQVIISNPAGSLVSNEAKLSVVKPVVILNEPKGTTKLFGEPYV